MHPTICYGTDCYQSVACKGKMHLQYHDNGTISGHQNIPVNIQINLDTRERLIKSHTSVVDISRGAFIILVVSSLIDSPRILSWLLFLIAIVMWILSIYRDREFAELMDRTDQELTTASFSVDHTFTIYSRMPIRQSLDSTPPQIRHRESPQSNPMTVD